MNIDIIDRKCLEIMESTRPGLVETLRKLLASGATPAAIRARFERATPFLKDVLEGVLSALTRGTDSGKP